MKPCEACAGTGWIEKTHPWYGQASCPEPTVDVRCDECGGVGSVAGTDDDETDEPEEVGDNGLLACGADGSSRIRD